MGLTLDCKQRIGICLTVIKYLSAWFWD